MLVGELELEYNKMGWETTGSIQGPKKKEDFSGGDGRGSGENKHRPPIRVREQRGPRGVFGWKSFISMQKGVRLARSSHTGNRWR